MIDFFVGFQLSSVCGTDRDQTGAVLCRCCIRQIIVGIDDLLIGFLRDEISECFSFFMGTSLSDMAQAEKSENLKNCRQDKISMC